VSAGERLGEWFERQPGWFQSGAGILAAIPIIVFNVWLLCVILGWPFPLEWIWG
jgi:hypothetical protein